MKPKAIFTIMSGCLAIGVAAVAFTILYFARCEPRGRRGEGEAPPELASALGSHGGSPSRNVSDPPARSVGASESPTFAQGEKYVWPRTAGKINFREVAAEAGVSFRFDTGSRGRHDLPEIMGGGVALFDADGDGRLDIFLCNGGPIEPTPGKNDPPCRLYHNQGAWDFEDITDRAAAPGPSYAMGTAVGDYDSDGRPDLLVTGWGDQRLYRNLGGGRFADVTIGAGLSSGLWSTSAAFADLDGDGDLDLYVASYLDFTAKSPPYCAAPDGRRDYCGPEDFPAQPDRLYRNNGDGTFTDVSRLAGIDRPEGRGRGVLIAELTGDNRPDIFVANDGTPCWLFANRGNLRFEDIADQAGGWFERPILGRGLAVGDLDGDGRPDIVINALDAPAAVLRNTSESGHFLNVDIIDHTGRTAVGARVRVTAGGRIQAAVVGAGGSYLSASPGRLYFGLGSALAAERIEVEWPWGQREFRTKPTRPADSSPRIEQGTGRPMP